MDILKINGTWTVTTEGDCEGRSVAPLGNYQGTIEEIALHLADRAYYNLYFYPMVPVNKGPYLQKKDNVNIYYNNKQYTITSSNKRQVMLYQLSQRRFCDLSEEEKTIFREAMRLGEV